jgi:hypothetical protein
MPQRARGGHVVTVEVHGHDLDVYADHSATEG